VPKVDEHTPWSIDPKTQSQSRTYWQNMLGPFRNWYVMLRSAGIKGAKSPTQYNEK
jgi:hypothetical protein